MSGNRRSHAATAHAFISNDAGRNLALIGGLSVYPMIYMGAVRKSRSQIYELMRLLCFARLLKPASR